MAERVRRLYNQMPDPKFVIAMGACTCGGGPYYKVRLQRREGRRPVVPVGRVRAGLPAAPEALLEGLMRVQDKVRRMRDLTKGQPEDCLSSARTGSVLLPPELTDPEKAVEFF